MIVIKHKQSSLSNILKEFPNAEIFDVTSKVGAINEYDFGKGTPEIKSMWNTLDFEPTQIIRNADGTIKEILRTSPFAYNSNNNIDKSNYA